MDEDVLINDRLRTLRESTVVDLGVVDNVIARVDRSRRRRRSVTYLAASVAAAAVVSAVGWGVMNEESGGDRSVTAVEGPSSPTSATESADVDLTWRNETEGYREELFAAAGRSSTFVGALIDDSQHALVVFGAADGPPEDVANLMASAPSGTNPRWQEVPYTEDELEAAIDRAIEESDRINGGTFGGDFASVIVYVWPADEAADQELQSRLARLLAPVPVAVEARPAADIGGV